MDQFLNFFQKPLQILKFLRFWKKIISQPFDLVPKHLANDTIRQTVASHSVSLMPNWKRSKRPYQLQVTTWLVSSCSKHHGYHCVVEANNLIQQLIGMKSKLRLSALSSCVRLNAFSSKGWEPSNRGCHIEFIKKMGHSQPLFLCIRHFYLITIGRKNFAHVGIWTADLWCRKRPLYQLSHHHCHIVNLVA